MMESTICCIDIEDNNTIKVSSQDGSISSYGSERRSYNYSKAYIYMYIKLNY